MSKGKLMSWTATGGAPLPKDSIAVDPPESGFANDASREQYEAAVQAAIVLARVVGRPGDHVYVSLSGHGNEGHAPADGWAEETLSIHISARPVADEPEPASTEPVTQDAPSE